MERTKSRGSLDLLAGPFQLDRHLCRVRVLGARVDLQFFDHLVRQFVLGQHAANGVVDQIFGFSLQTVAVAFQTQTRVAGVPRVVADVHFAARHRDLFGVGDDDKVAAIDVRRVLRAMLAHQNDRDVAGQTAQNFIRRVDDVPLLFDLARFGNKTGLSDHGNDLMGTSGC